MNFSKLLISKYKWLFSHIFGIWLHPPDNCEHHSICEVISTYVSYRYRGKYLSTVLAVKHVEQHKWWLGGPSNWSKDDAKMIRTKAIDGCNRKENKFKTFTNLAAFACDDSIVDARWLVSADFAWYDFNLSWKERTEVKALHNHSPLFA